VESNPKPENKQIMTPKFTVNKTQQSSQYLNHFDHKEYSLNQCNCNTNSISKETMKCNFCKFKNPSPVIHKKNIDPKQDVLKQGNIEVNKENIQSPYLNFVSFDQEYKTENKFL
jgi:hypothetical protein